ncbi:MAG: O-antigen ligase family protein [bacterium]|nr:O-antigen ligase family protein [bacterium]
MFELKLEKYTRILLYAVPFLVLIFIEGFYFPFVITRTVLFRLLVQLGLSLYLLLLALNFNKYRPRFNWALALVVIFFLIQLAAAIFGYDFYKSFWSDFERMEGVVSLIYLAIYLFLLQIFLREKGQWLFYIRLILMASVLVSLYGLAQKFNILPVFEAGIGRVTSTIGNAAFLAGYLLLTAGLGVYYYFNEENKNYRYLALAAAALNTIVLLLTSTRGAILGLAAGILFYLILSALFSAGRLKKYSLVILIATVLIFAIFYQFRSNFAGSKIEFINRLATISLNDGSVTNRLRVWRMALNDFKFHPLLGVGMENFEVVYNKYYTPDITENWFDRTHNVYLDQLTAAGAFGLAAYLAILFYLFYALFKQRKSDYVKFSVLSSLLIAYAIHNFFVFDTINTSFIYFFLIGFIGFADGGSTSKLEVEPRPNNRAFNYVFIGLIIINIFAIYKLVYLPLKINRAIYVGYYYVIADTFRSYENFKTALNYKFGSVEAAVQLNNMYDVVLEKSGANTRVKENYYELNREKLKFASNNFPLDIKTKMYLAQLILNNYKDKAELEQAEGLLKRSIELSPTRVEPYYLLYNVYKAEGKNDLARAVLEDLIVILPWYGGAKIMLMSELAADDPARAEELYSAGVKQSYHDSYGGLLKIINYLLNRQRYEETIPYYKNLFRNESDRYDYHLDLAKVYYLTGRIDEAVEEVNLISEKSPLTLEGYEAFVNMVYEAYNKS